MPEEKSATQRARADERAQIVTWMRTFPMNQHAREWANIIEAHEDETEDPRETAQRIAFAQETNNYGEIKTILNSCAHCKMHGRPTCSMCRNAISKLKGG